MRRFTVETSPKNKARGDLLKRLLFIALANIFFFAALALAAELTLQYLLPPSLTDPGPRNPFYIQHPVRGHALKPGYRGGSSWGVPFEVNSLGFRGPEISRQKPQGTFRILCLGDSITMGVGMTYETLYPALAQKYLADEFPETNVEAINAGVAHYDIRQESELFIEQGLELSPDAVVLQFCVNDLPNVPLSDLIRPNRDLPIPGKDWLAEHSALAAFIKERYRRIGLKNSFFGLAPMFEMRPDSEEAENINRGWQIYENCLSTIDRVCKESNIMLLLLYVPHRAQLEDVNRLMIPQNRLAALAREYNIAFLDVTQKYLSLKEPPYCFPDPVHPSPLGHRIIADAIFEYLTQTPQAAAFNKKK